ncbi:MAG: UDP-N-acetylmuramate dehydrogenase [Lachnospiraceae bacterium]|nr:UDP-N-acetylmuramate dehydrogenase [Lachnospiraceae bacterium]
MTENLYESLCGITGGERVKVNEPMKNHTTFRIGGNADYFVTPDTKEELQQILQLLNREQVPFFILGNGSNLLVSDAGYRGVVLQIGRNYRSMKKKGCRIRVKAGITMAGLAAFALENSLTGLEFASGIPGTAGGGAIMNAGAYGSEMKDVLLEVLCMDRQGELLTLAGEEMELSYRDSRMKREQLIVLELLLELKEGDQDAIRLRQEELKEARTSKQPLEYPSAGSTFKRPEGTFAGKLIMDAGLKGYQIGGARVSEKHAGFVINAGGATAADVKALMEHIVKTVQDQFGVTLEPEVLFLGE